MCGICGVLAHSGSWKSSVSLDRMALAMVHRGPDGSGTYAGDRVGLAMRRLAIIDVEGGRQPLSDENERYHVILNGEIYNYVELRSELLERGHRFKSRSDTEVIVHLFEEQGIEAVQRLNGMFAFAVWDAEREELFLARDRLGIKPLYYANDAKRLVFSSDLGSLMAGLGTAEVNQRGLFEYLGLGFVPHPDSLMKDVNKLPPGCYLHVSDGSVRMGRYWSLPDPGEGSLSAAEVLEKLHALSVDSVRVQLRSDVPVGLFLSGGLDSSAVLGLVSGQMSAPVRSFSVGFPGGYNELEEAAAVAKMHGAEHSAVTIKGDDVGQLLLTLIRYLDEPVADNSIIPSFAVSRLARDRGIKVVLTGAGGDELFGGYRRYFDRTLGRRALSLLPRWARRFTGGALRATGWSIGVRVADPTLDFLLSTSGADLLVLRRFLRDKGHATAVEETLHRHYASLVERAPGKGSHKRMLMGMDMSSYLVDDILALTDKMTMAASIEARVPLLDHRIVEEISSLPDGVLFARDEPKYLGKLLFRRYQPPQLWNLPKRGFAGPPMEWMNSAALIDLAQHHLVHRPSALIQDYFDVRVLAPIIRQQRKPRGLSLVLWSLLVLDLWYKATVLREDLDP